MFSEVTNKELWDKQIGSQKMMGWLRVQGASPHRR